MGKISRFYKEKYGNAINNIKNNEDNKIKWYNYWKNFRKWILLWLNYSRFLKEKIISTTTTLIKQIKIENNIIENPEWLNIPVTMQYQRKTWEEKLLPLWKYINSIALLTQTNIKTKVENDENDKNIVISSLDNFKKSIDEIIKNDTIGDFNKQIVFYHFPETTQENLGMNCLPLFNWREDNNIFKSYYEEEINNIKAIRNEMEEVDGDDNNTDNQEGGGVKNLNNFISKVIKAKEETGDDTTAAEDEIYENFIKNIGDMKQQLEQIEYNKNMFEIKRNTIIGELKELIDKKNRLDKFDLSQEKMI